MRSVKDYGINVFINCPFDLRYRRLFRAIIFAVTDCGYVARCAQELSDGSVERASKIFDLIGECRFGVHDISRTQLDSKLRLPRFNMPLELGMFLGAKQFGSGVQKTKVCLVLDKEKYRFQSFISDLGGKDIYAHENEASNVIRIVRDWLTSQQTILIPGAKKMTEKYTLFLNQLPAQTKELGLTSSELTFVDYRFLVESWLERYDEECA